MPKNEPDQRTIVRHLYSAKKGIRHQYPEACAKSLRISIGPMSDPERAFGPSRFPTTQWTLLIEVIQKGGDDAAFAALSELFERYRPAIQHFFRQRGHSEPQAEDDTQAFFHSRVVQPWNRRHGLLSMSYSEEDVKKLPLFASKLKRRDRPIAQFLWGALSEATRQMLQDYSGGEEETKALRAALSKDLNHLIEGQSVYDERRFADVELSVESRNLLGRELKGCWITWLNRSLLGDAFPRHLVKGIGFLYLVERKEQRKFRTFLAHALWCFLKDQTKGEETEKSGGGVSHASLEELEESGHEVGAEIDEEFGREFDRAFAAQIISLAANRSKHSKQLEAHLRGEISQKEAGRELGMSEGAFKAAYNRFRGRLAKNLWVEVSKVVGPDEREIEAEIRHLLSLFAN